MSTEENEKMKRYDVQWVMSTEQGRRFVWELLSLCGVYRSLEGDPNAMLVQEGGRRVGLHLLGITTDASEELVFKMMLEAKNRKIEEIPNDDSSKPDTSDPSSEYDYAISGGTYESGDELPAYDSIGSFL